MKPRKQNTWQRTYDKLVDKGTSSSTKRVYQRDEQYFWDWVKKHLKRRKRYPTNVDTVIQFCLYHLAENSPHPLKVSSLRRYLSTLSIAHQRAEKDSPTSHSSVKLLLTRTKINKLLICKLPKTDTILAPIIESLMEAFDEFHSQKSKMDSLRGMRENIKQGWRADGRAILGYQLEKHIVGTRKGSPVTKSKLIPDPKFFHIIQQYLKSRAKGESRRALTNRLNLDVPYTTLAYIEESVLTYAGHTVWNRHNEYSNGEYTSGKKFRDRSE